MFERVLIPTDLSSESDKIFEYALGLSGLREVVAVHGIEASAFEYTKKEKEDEPQEPVAAHGINPSAVEIRYMQQEIKKREDRLSEKGEIFHKAGIRFRTLVDEVKLIDMQICEVAERENASLILIGSHGKSPWEEILYGSVSEKVARKSRIPVLVLRYDLFEKSSPAELAAGNFRKVLFPTDLSPSSDGAFDIVKRLRPQEVTVLHVSKTGEMDEDEAERLKATAEKKFEIINQDLKCLGARSTIITRYGDVLEEILKASEDTTSVVMASHGKGILKEWLTGSVSLNVARKAGVPVLLVH